MLGYHIITNNMPAIVLIIGLVCLPLVVVGCLLIAYFKVRRTHVHDIERTNEPDGISQTIDSSIVLRDISRISWPLKREIGPTNVAAVAKPLPTPGGQIQSAGRGFFETFHPTPRDEQENEKSGHGRAYEGFDQAQIYNSYYLPPSNPQIQMPRSIPISAYFDDLPEFYIQTPQPAYTYALSGRLNSTRSTAALTHGEHSRATEARAHIDNRESLLVTKDMRTPTDLPTNEFENANVEEGNGKDWKQDTPGGVFTVGDGEDEEEEAER
jgi:hypothetical protein